MGKQNLSKIARDVRVTVSKHSPEILLGIGIAGMITTTVLAVRSTPKALRLIDEKKHELETDTLTPADVVKTTWKCYIPAAVSGTASIACLIGSNSVNAKRNAALATAYKLSYSAFTQYKNKVIETSGEKKEKVVRDKVSEEQLKNNPVTNTEVIITGKGQTLFFEPLSSRYFYSSIEKIRRAENEINHRILTDPFDSGVTVNDFFESLFSGGELNDDFYEELGLTGTATGEMLGWNLNIGMLDIYLSYQGGEEGSDHEGEPCAVINYNIPPSYDTKRY